MSDTSDSPLGPIVALQAQIAAAKSRGWTQEAIENLIRRTLQIAWFATLDKQSPWTMFTTMTFRPESRVPRHHAATAGLRFQSWLSRWRSGWHLKPSVHQLVLWSAEEHKSGDVHLHALWAHTRGRSQLHCARCKSQLSDEEPDWRVFKDSWFIHWGIGRFYPYDEKMRFGAERYVVKYILDERCLDWGIWTG